MHRRRSSRGSDWLEYPACLFSTDTKNPSVPVRRGVISRPSADCSVAAANSSALSQSTVTVCAGGTTAKSGWRREKGADLVAVFRRQYRAGDVGDPAARLDQGRGAIEHLDLVLQPDLERARAHPPLGVGVAPPGAGSRAGRIDQHQIGGGIDVAQRYRPRPSASARRNCARRRATAAHRSARAGACRGRSRSAGPCPASSPPAPGSCRRRRRRDRSPARRVLPPTTRRRAASPRPAPRWRP